MSTEPSGAIKFPAVETWKDQYSVAKTQTFYVCQNCGKKSLRYMGKCPACGEWNTMQEEVEQRDSPAVARNIAPSGFRSVPERLKDVSTEHNPRWQVQVEEFSRVLGGGIVPGSIILLGGEPGIVKSTVLAQIAALFAQTTGKVLYVSGEESARQIKMRAERLGLAADELSRHRNQPGSHHRARADVAAAALDRRFDSD